MLDLISIKIPLSALKKLAYQKAYYQKKKLLKGEGQNEQERSDRKNKETKEGNRRTKKQIQDN